MEQFRRGIEAVRPDDRAQVVINPDLAEVVQIPQRLAKRPVEQERTVDVADDAVVELNSKVVAVKRGHVGHAKHGENARAEDRWDPEARGPDNAMEWLHVPVSGAL